MSASAASAGLRSSALAATSVQEPSTASRNVPTNGSLSPLGRRFRRPPWRSFAITRCAEPPRPGLNWSAVVTRTLTPPTARFFAAVPVLPIARDSVFFARWSIASTHAPAFASGLSTRAWTLVKSSGLLLEAPNCGSNSPIESTTTTLGRIQPDKPLTITSNSPAPSGSAYRNLAGSARTSSGAPRSRSRVTVASGPLWSRSITAALPPPINVSATAARQTHVLPDSGSPNTRFTWPR